MAKETGTATGPRNRSLNTTKILMDGEWLFYEFCHHHSNSIRPSSPVDLLHKVYKCGVFIAKLVQSDIPRPISSEAVVTAEVQVRPDEILFQHDIKEKTLFVSCGAENGKPYASASIIIDEKLGRTINGNDLVNASYQLTKAFDGKVFEFSILQ